MTASRKARGLHADKCRQCRTGLTAGEQKTFAPWCQGCLDKLAAGLRTGNEPAPSMHPTKNRPRMPAAKFARLLATQRAEKVHLGGFRARTPFACPPSTRASSCSSRGTSMSCFFAGRALRTFRA